MLMITRMYKWLQVCLAVVSQYNKSIITVEDPIGAHCVFNTVCLSELYL